jgi:hypothetical protein
MATAHKAKSARRTRDQLTVSHRERLIGEVRADPKLAADYLNAAAEEGDARVYLAARIGGRNGHTETSDGIVKADLSVPKEMGGPILAAPPSAQGRRSTLVARSHEGAVHSHRRMAQAARRAVFRAPGHQPADARRERQRRDRIVAPIVLLYGSLETPEFKRQTREFAEALKKAGKPVKLVYAEGYNHYEIAETIANPYGFVGREILEQMRLRSV